MIVNHVNPEGVLGEPGYSETVKMVAVAKASYADGGTDEDNTYAHYSPNGGAFVTIQNPALFGKFKVGQKYYVDFTESAA